MLGASSSTTPSMEVVHTWKWVHWMAFGSQTQDSSNFVSVCLYTALHWHLILASTHACTLTEGATVLPLVSVRAPIQTHWTAPSHPKPGQPQATGHQ